MQRKIEKEEKKKFWTPRKRQRAKKIQREKESEKETKKKRERERAEQLYISSCTLFFLLYITITTPILCISYIKLTWEVITPGMSSLESENVHFSFPLVSWRSVTCNINASSMIPVDLKDAKQPGLMAFSMVIREYDMRSIGFLFFKI